MDSWVSVSKLASPPAFLLVKKVTYHKAGRKTRRKKLEWGFLVLFETSLKKKDIFIYSMKVSLSLGDITSNEAMVLCTIVPITSWGALYLLEPFPVRNPFRMLQHGNHL